ncbi:MAG: creatininase family protein [Thermoflexales bacterium]|nr:creatininase family protein [Thermoflexales bacterium]MDW8350700.1 creatininase family protein [Anaerolineae bacterium]
MQYGELTWPELRAQAQAGKVVVFPTGSLEQHGHHLPLLTDSMIGGEIARRAEAELGDAALFLPMLWVGASHHHLPFAAVSLSAPLYVEVLKEMLGCIIAAGFRRIFMLNAHGGNEVPAMMAIQQLQLQRYKEHPDLFIAFSSWFGGIARDQIAQIEALEQKFVTHACELETSVILRIRPTLVHMDLARGAHYSYPSEFWTPDAAGPSRVTVGVSFDQITQTGALGHPELATADKGERILAAATREVVRFVREFATWQPVRPN